MTPMHPGAYVLYKDPASSQPPWPGVIYDESIAPRGVLDRRPSAYMTLVLLIKDPYIFRWATKPQLSPLTSAREAGVLVHSRDLSRAYKMALDRRESGWKLRDWQSIIDAESNYTPLYQGLLETDDEDDLREAKRRSLEDYKNSKSCNSLKSPNVLDEGQDEVVELYSTPRTKTHSQLSFPKQHQFSPFRSPLDQLVSFGQRSAAPTSDIIECDLSESKEFVHVVVGPEHEIRKFHAEILFKRPYFRDQRTGINFFELNQKGIYELRHPQLNNIHVDDFQFVAEFLTSGGFGIRQAEGDVQTQEAIFQCVSAWEAAEKLGAHDMLYHIAVKVQTLAWDDDNLLALANVVYRSSGPAVHAQEELKDAHTELKEWISETLAHRFWAIIDDKTIGKRFRRRLKRFPELERNVFSQRAQRLTMGAEMVEDAESDDDNVR